MKRRMATIILTFLISSTLYSCENRTAVDSTQEAINPITEAASEEKKPEDSTSVTVEPKKPVVESVTPAVTDNTTNAIPLTLDIPPFSYYLSDKVKPDDRQPLQLTMIASAPNEITDDNKWFIDNNLALNTYEVPNSYRYITGNLPEKLAKQWDDLFITSAFYDDSYIYCTYGSNFSEGYKVRTYNMDYEFEITQ